MKKSPIDIVHTSNINSPMLSDVFVHQKTRPLPKSILAYLLAGPLREKFSEI